MVEPHVLHDLPQRDAEPPLPSPVLSAPRLLLYNEELAREVFPSISKASIRGGKMPALISHLVMPQEAAASFLLERATVFLQTLTDGVLVRSWKQVISSPSFTLIPYTAHLSLTLLELLD